MKTFDFIAVFSNHLVSGFLGSFFFFLLEIEEKDLGEMRDEEMWREVVGGGIGEKRRMFETKN